MKKVLYFLFLACSLLLIYFFKDPIVDYICENYIYRKEIIITDSNEYKINSSISYVSETDNFEPNNYQELLNAFYTILNNGWDGFVFYCGKGYDTCIDDVNDLINDYSSLSIFNNFVHPFNSYETISVNINNIGRIIVKIKKLYSDSDIEELNLKMDQIINEIITENMTEYDKVKAIHNYIINNSVYDATKETMNNKAVYANSANTAYGPLINGVAICGGYTDAMSIFLYKLGIDNYKISNDSHIWNYVYIDSAWKHLDLTWDDPITNNGTNVLSHTFFLITTDELFNIDTNSHEFDKNIYSKI